MNTKVIIGAFLWTVFFILVGINAAIAIFMASSISFLAGEISC